MSRRNANRNSNDLASRRLSHSEGHTRTARTTRPVGARAGFVTVAPITAAAATVATHSAPHEDHWRDSPHDHGNSEPLAEGSLAREPEQLPFEYRGAPPNAKIANVFSTVSALSQQLQILQQRRTAELAAKSGNLPVCSASAAGDCAICLETLTSPESVITQCGHVFHRDCITKCPRLPTTAVPCPVCRRHIYEGELVTVRNGLPQKELVFSPQSSPIDDFPHLPVSSSANDWTSSVPSPSSLSFDNTESENVNGEDRQETAESQDLTDLISGGVEDVPDLTTQSKCSNISSRFVKVPCFTANKTSAERVSDAPRIASAFDDDLASLLAVVRGALHRAIRGYEKARSDLKLDFVKKSDFLHKQYLEHRNRNDAESASLNSREQKVKLDEMRIRKKLEEAEALLREHNENIAKVNEEKEQLASRSRLIDEENAKLECARASLTDKEWELRDKETRLKKMIQKYKKLSSLPEKGGDSSTNTPSLPTDPSSEASGKTTFRDANRGANRDANSSDGAGAKIDPTLIMGEQLYEPARTSRPLSSRLPRAKGAGNFKKNSACLSSFSVSRPGVQRPSSAIGKLRLTRR